LNPSHGLSWEKSGEQEGVFATLFILTGKLDNKNNFIIKSSENEKLNADVVIIKHNKMIQIRFDGFKNLTLNTYNTLFVLPDEFKPVSGAFYDCSNPNGEIYRIVISY